MTSRKFFGLAALMGGVLCGCSTAQQQPRYHGKSLSEWIPLAPLRYESPGIEAQEAFKAIGHIGTNSIPWLLLWLRSDDAGTAKLGIKGFELLGPIAKPAVPQLLAMAGDWQTSATWSNAIPALASLRETNGFAFAFSDLLPLATNPAVPGEIRARTVQSIAEIPYDDSARPLFLQCLHDGDWRVAAAAADGMGRWPMDPARAIPALAAALSSRTNGPQDVEVRASAAEALSDFAALIYYSSSRSKTQLDELREAMSGAAPVMLPALNDEDWQVAHDTAMALGRAAVKPDIVIPALVKSLNSAEPEVRDAVIVALGNFGAAAQSAVPSLSAIAASDPDGHAGGRYAASALEKIVPPK